MYVSGQTEVIQHVFEWRRPGALWSFVPWCPIYLSMFLVESRIMIIQKGQFE